MYYVYILANKSNSVLYIGVTNNLERRIFEHKNNLIDGFTKKYNVYKLLYFEACLSPNDAITREKQLKKWTRTKKFELIYSLNPTLKDLSEET